MRILTLVASGQPEANLESARYFLEHTSTIKKISIFSSQYMTSTGAPVRLQRVLEALYPVATEIIDVPGGIEEHNMLQLQQLIMDWVAQQDRQNTFLFNVTGGTKLFSIAFDRVSALMASKRAECFYQSRDHHIVWYQRHTGKILYPIHTNLGLLQRVQARSYQITRQQQITELPIEDWQYAQHLIENLKVNFHQGRRFCSLMHKLAGQAETQMDYRVDIQQIEEKSRKQLYDLAEVSQQRYFCYDEQQQILSFRNKASCQYVKGGWLEVYAGFEAYKALYALNPQAELAINVELKKQGTPNEMDVMFIYQAQLYCLECKAGKTMAEDSAKEVLYKLSALGDFGGINQKRAVVSLYSLREHNLLRAHNTEIKIFQEKELLNLQQCIQDWLSQQSQLSAHIS